MKVIQIDDEETKLTKRQKQKIAILKLTENGKYLEGIGIRDNGFFLLTEGDEDEQYLAFMFLDTQPSLIDNAKLLELRFKASVLNKMMAILKGDISCLNIK
jgi:hypothetical protein